jgi:hypothetical protein
MRVTIVGFLTDYKSRVLLQQPEPGQRAPVTASLVPGVLPAEALAHAFRAATGLIVWPVRLVGVYFSDYELIFSYRCSLRGGELRPPAGQPPAGYFDNRALPRGLNTVHRRLLDDALHHAGGPAQLARLSATRREGLARLFKGRKTTGTGTDWAVFVLLVVQDGEGQIVCERHPGGIWRPLWVDGEFHEPPWETAAQRLAKLLPDAKQKTPELRLVQVRGQSSLEFVFVVPPYPKEAFAHLPWGSLDLWRLEEVGSGFDQEDAAPDAALAREALAAGATIVRPAP